MLFKHTTLDRHNFPLYVYTIFPVVVVAVIVRLVGRGRVACAIPGSRKKVNAPPTTLATPPKVCRLLWLVGAVLMHLVASWRGFIFVGSIAPSHCMLASLNKSSEVVCNREMYV